ncbi:flagellar basal-body rod protein FlgB [Pullulanibacillus pueri]|uniref:Flagellar basal body rod protein FlgB n=1 Tax=Pullulanibacillus pueri TaxID=1437324 RepID=A0A8J2ZWQ2_9BACL|nr:flagellar basal body rod protein FlgB [Pullulanibacillus pueri]MBM7682471.1 flagellar basal-body rod protein FlgB [Pullulanibacillus pueri]GGH82265.1 flagellar basal body rod protein FlgB [Pullulanibacillus pueri]
MAILNLSSIGNLQRALDQTSLSQNVISQNIANIDTPNYKAKKVVFGDVLQSAMTANRTDPRHFEFSNSGQSQIVVDRNSSIQNNGNNVDADEQMTELAKTQLQYQSYTEAISREFNKLNIVLGGGQ